MIKTILIIEDDRFIGEMYVRSLKGEGFEVDWLVDGEDGMTAVLNKPYDLVLLDIMLPEKKGTEILVSLRGEGKDLIPDTKVFILTNFDQDDDSKLATQQYVDAYLIKAEITPRKLISLIRKLDKK